MLSSRLWDAHLLLPSPLTLLAHSVPVFPGSRAALFPLIKLQGYFEVKISGTLPIPPRFPGCLRLIRQFSAETPLPLEGLTWPPESPLVKHSQSSSSSHMLSKLFVRLDIYVCLVYQRANTVKSETLTTVLITAIYA